jgi:hypothetical protein
MPVLIILIIISVLLSGIINLFPPTVAAEDDGERYEFNTTLLRLMASRSARLSIATAYDNNVVRDETVSMADHGGVK